MTISIFESSIARSTAVRRMRQVMRVDDKSSQATELAWQDPARDLLLGINAANCKLPGIGDVVGDLGEGGRDRDVDGREPNRHGTAGSPTVATAKRLVMTMSISTSSTARDAARSYIRRGWKPIVSGEVTS